MNGFVVSRLMDCVTPVVRRALAASLIVLAASAPLLLSGCAGSMLEAGTPAQSGLAIQGNVHGGQQPVQFATIQLFAAQATGYSAASQSQLINAVSTDVLGNFTISGDYNCPASPNDQMYLVATGGNSGSGTNANLRLMAALGKCSLLSSSNYIVINEPTTVAAVYALSGFMSDYQHVGTSSTNYVGLSNAFATAANLVNPASGVARTVTPAYATLPAGATSATFASTVPQATIYSLANIIATCVNTNGVGGSSNACVNIFAAARPSASAPLPSDTIQALLDIAQNPGNNVSTLFSYSTANPPFIPVLSVAPNDWTLSLTFVGGGLGGTNGLSNSQSTGLALDAAGNVWVSNSNTATVTELSNLGVPLSTTTKLTPSVVPGGFMTPSLAIPAALAVDLTGNIWVADNGVNEIAKLTNSGSPVGTGFVFGNNSDFSSGIAIDASNNAWFVASGSIIELANNGTAIGSPYTTLISQPTGAIAIDGTNNIWIENGGSASVLELSSAGTILGYSGNQLPAPTSHAAIDGTGQLWAPQGTPGSGEYSFSFPNGHLTQSNVKPASMINPVGVCVDGLSHVWTTVAGNTSLGPNPNITETTSAGTVLSPNATGFTGSSVSVLVNPGTCEPDSSGNLWVVSNTSNASKVVEFVGLSAPSIMPLALAAKNNAIGTRP